MQLCLKGDDCETGVLGESVRMPLLFLQPFFSCLFPCILRIVTAKEPVVISFQFFLSLSHFLTSSKSF